MNGSQKSQKKLREREQLRLRGQVALGNGIRRPVNGYKSQNVSIPKILPRKQDAHGNAIQKLVNCFKSPNVSAVFGIDTKKQENGLQKRQRKLPRREKLKPRRQDVLGNGIQRLANGYKIPNVSRNTGVETRKQEPGTRKSRKRKPRREQLLPQRRDVLGNVIQRQASGYKRPNVSILVPVVETRRQAHGTQKSLRKPIRREQLKPQKQDVLGKEMKKQANGLKSLSV